MEHTEIVSTQNAHVRDSPSDMNPSQNIDQNQASEASTLLSFTERYKIGFKYIPELYSGGTPFGKIMFVFKIVAAIAQSILGVVIILITKDQNPDIRFVLFLVLYTLVHVSTLIFLPYSFTKPKPTHNDSELVEVENNRDAVRFTVYAIQFLLLLLTLLPVGTTTSHTIAHRNIVIIYLLLYIIGITLPAFLFLLAIVFFPCTCFYFIQADESDTKLLLAGASDELISSFPIFGFRKRKTERVDLEAPGSDSTSNTRMSDNQMKPIIPMNDGQSDQTGESSTSKTSISKQSENPKPEKKKPRFKLFSRSNKTKGKQSTPSSESNANINEDILELNDDDDATCTICLCEYEEGDRFRQLGCKHHFHKDCIDEWLHLKGKCPLCIQGLEELPYKK